MLNMTMVAAATAVAAGGGDLMKSTQLGFIWDSWAELGFKLGFSSPCEAGERVVIGKILVCCTPEVRRDGGG
jgi:hypothetical protein